MVSWATPPQQHGWGPEIRVLEPCLRDVALSPALMFKQLLPSTVGGGGPVWAVTHAGTLKIPN